MRQYSDTEKKIFWAGRNLQASVHTFFKLMQYYGDIDMMWEKFDQDDPGLDFVSPEVRSHLAKTRDMTRVDKAVGKLGENEFVTYKDLPARLCELEDAPILLYYRGKFDFPQSIAMVGTRRATQYGKDVAFALAADLAKAGVTVVSGGARGIDSAAHRGVLSVGGSTVCVFGTGIDVTYPEENAELYDKIVACGGGIVSEFPPGMQPGTWSFPMRNRIISGLSWGTILVESAKRSGAHITARAAAEQGRDVFCVPGNITSPVSRGTNKLLQEGAKVLLCADDILDEYGWKAGAKQERCLPPDLDETQSKIVRALMEKDSQSVDQLASTTGLALQELNASLTMLEIQGIITQLPGKLFTV